MKLLGAALVAAAFAVLGASEALRLRRRARLTSELAAGLELLRGEIVSRLAPMPEAAERLARVTARRVRASSTPPYAPGWRALAARSFRNSGVGPWACWT